MKNKKGFTLIEALVVLAIISLLVALALPIFLSLKQSQETIKVKGVIIDKIAAPQSSSYYIIVSDIENKAVRQCRISIKTFYDERIKVGARLPIDE